AGPAWLNPRPADREPVCADAEVGHQRHVLRPAVIVVVGYIAGVPVADNARLTAEGIPDRVGPAVLGHRALDLVGGSGDTPGEAGRELREVKIAHGFDRNGL